MFWATITNDHVEKLQLLNVAVFMINWKGKAYWKYSPVTCFVADLYHSDLKKQYYDWEKLSQGKIISLLRHQPVIESEAKWNG